MTRVKYGFMVLPLTASDNEYSVEVDGRGGTEAPFIRVARELYEGKEFDISGGKQLP